MPPSFLFHVLLFRLSATIKENTDFSGKVIVVSGQTH